MKRVESTVQTLQQIYVIVVALAIAEAIMQSVAIPDSNHQQVGICLERALPLLTFLLLVIPFYHGMSRFVSDVYEEGKARDSYGRWLLFDCSFFTTEAVLFFVLARSMARPLWFQFCTATIVLFVVDIVWGSITWSSRTSIVHSWVIVNLIATPLLGVILFCSRNSVPWVAMSLAFVLILARTVADYWTTWDFYFPRTGSGHSGQAPVD